MTHIQSVIKEFGQNFPNKLGEVIDDFGSSVKSDIQLFIIAKHREYVEEKCEEKKDFIIPNDKYTEKEMEIALKSWNNSLNALKSSIKSLYE